MSVATVRSARHPGRKTTGGKTRPVRINDVAGLCLQITPSNSKSWVFRYSRHGKSHEMGLGPADPEGRSGLSLAEARERAAKAKRQLIDGLDPIAIRNKATEERLEAEKNSKEHTFRIAFEGYFAAHRSGWSSDRHAQQWRSTIEKFVLPTIGDMDVAAISVDHIVDIFKPLWTKMPETASRTRQRVEAILEYAAAPVRKWRSGQNPATWKGVLKPEFPSVAKIHTVRHHPSLPWIRIAAFMTALDRRGGIAAKTVKFTILTACRPAEARKATWNEVDLENMTWTKPSFHTKRKRLHRVPLSRPAVDLLLAIRSLSSGKSHNIIFRAPFSGGALGDKELSGLAKRMSFDGLAEGQLPRWRDSENRAVDVHGFRSSFKAWSRTTSYPDYLSEIALAHVDRDRTRAAYAREDLLDERRPLMEAWGKLCTEPSANIADIDDERRRRTRQL